MGLAKKHGMELEDESLAAATQAKALIPCAIHRDEFYRAGDDDAERMAYAIATNRWKTGKLICDRDELMAAVNDAIEMAAEECPRCEAFRDA